MVSYVSASNAPTATAVASPSAGSQTQTIIQQQPQPVTFGPSAISPTLRLRGAPSHDRRVTWDSAVIDNEGMGKKKSKVCCIFHPNRPFGESSDESSSDSSSESESDSDDDGRARPTNGNQRKCNHNHGKGSSRKNANPKPNAYERTPKPPLKRVQSASN